MNPFRMRSVSFLLGAFLLSAGLCVIGQTPVLADGFESGRIDAGVWDQRVNGAATLTVENVEGCHGKYALRVHYPDMAARSYAFVVATHLPESVRSHLFGRAYVKITPALGMTHDPLLFAGGPGWPLSKFDEIGASKGNWMPSYQENKSLAGHGRGEVTYHSNVSPPLNRWFLLEWEFNDHPASIRYWVDGAPVATMANGEATDKVTFCWPKDSTNGNDIVGGFEEFGLGARVWGMPGAGFDVYYDDIAMSTSRIGPAQDAAAPDCAGK